MNNLQIKIRDRIRAAQRVLVTSHIRPDGDAIGSCLGLTLALLDASKQVQAVLSDGLPASFKHLPGSEIISEQNIMAWLAIRRRGKACCMHDSGSEIRGLFL